jgi:hypothetical protein
MVEVEYLIDRARRYAENFKHENRYAVVSMVEIDQENPHLSRVILDRGERDVNKHGIYQEFEEVTIPTSQMVEEGWGKQDLVYIGLFGRVQRIASYEFLKEIGADVDTIYERFIDWIDFDEETRRKKELEEYFKNLPPPQL